MVITPEGETVVAPVALWNKRHVEPPPAASFGWAFLRMYCPKNMLI